MKRSLVGHLRDPKDLKPVQLAHSEPSEGEEILSGSLRAENGDEYAIAGGVPMMVRTQDFAEGQKETVESFSWKWEKAKEYRTQTLGHYQQWYLQRYGFDSADELSKFLAGKECILDAGTAHGRDAQMYHDHSTAQVFGVDISTGIQNAYRDLKGLERLNLVQGDLANLPFAHEQFDFIGCDQVIHHTPDTRQSLHNLLKRLKVGGHINFYCYKVKAPTREFCDDYIRERTTKMSPEECMKVSEQITHLAKALTELNVQIDVPVDIPILGIEKGKQDIQRFIYWNWFKCYWNETMPWEANVITNFDWYHPLHAHRHTPEELRQWCQEEQLEVEHFDVQESGISVRARKLA